MKIEIIEPKQEYKVLGKSELDFYQPEAGQILELAYLERRSVNPKEVTGIFMLADTMGASAYLVDLETGIAEKTMSNNPLSNVAMNITKVSYLNDVKLTIKKGGC